MPSYQTQKTISSYTVDKGLLKQIEMYCKSAIPEIIHANELHPTINFFVALHDSNGSEKYSSIDEFGLPRFRNDIKSIIVEFEILSLQKELKMTLRFGKEDENSDILIALVDENPRDKVSAIEHGIVSVLNQNKNLHWLFYPNSLISIATLCGGIYMGIQATEQGYSAKEKFLFGLVFWSSVVYLFVIRYFKGYSSFDSKKQKHTDKWLAWIVTGLIGFLLFTTLLTSVRKEIFGF